MPRFVIIGLIFLLLLLAWVLKEFLSAFVASSNFNIYIMRNHKEIWRQITSIGSGGPGLSNPFSTYKWLRSNFESNDAKLITLKCELKTHYDRFLVSFLSFSVYLTLFYFIGNMLFGEGVR